MGFAMGSRFCRLQAGLQRACNWLNQEFTCYYPWTVAAAPWIESFRTR